jgi:putative endonuclease
MVEQGAVNAKVVGSSPTTGANQIFTTSMYWVYILQNPAGKFYVGQTGNLEVRIQSHNTIGLVLGKFTRKNGPWNLVWQEPHETRSSAVQRERLIKSWKSSKAISGLIGQTAVSSMVESRQSRD